VGAEGMVKKSEMLRSPQTKYKRSKITFSVTSIVLTCAPFCTKLLEILFPSQICHLSRKREAGRFEGHLAIWAKNNRDSVEKVLGSFRTRIQLKLTVPIADSQELQNQNHSPLLGSLYMSFSLAGAAATFFTHTLQNLVFFF
jgi:hypothetical protein